MAILNFAYFYETSKKVRGGRRVWVKDSNGENRRNVLLGGTVANPNKGFGYLWAAQLLQYTPGKPIYIFRSFQVAEAAEATATTFKVNGDGYSDAPEVGQVLMIAPDEATGTGQSGVVTAVKYDATKKVFEVTVDTALGALTTDTILVEAEGDAANASAKVLVPNPNTFQEADIPLLPTEGYGLDGTANYSASAVYDKQAWIAFMQPLPKYVLAKNRSYIDGIFWI